MTQFYKQDYNSLCTFLHIFADRVEVTRTRFETPLSFEPSYFFLMFDDDEIVEVVEDVPFLVFSIYVNPA